MKFADIGVGDEAFDFDGDFFLTALRADRAFCP
jgi:hypothetical protein